MELRAYDRCVDALHMVRGLRDMVIAGVFDPSYGNEDAPYAALQVLNAIETALSEILEAPEGPQEGTRQAKCEAFHQLPHREFTGVRNIAEKHAPPIAKVSLHGALSGHCDSSEPSASSFSESHPSNNPALPRTSSAGHPQRKRSIVGGAHPRSRAL